MLVISSTVEGKIVTLIMCVQDHLHNGTSILNKTFVDLTVVEKIFLDPTEGCSLQLETVGPFGPTFTKVFRRFFWAFFWELFFLGNFIQENVFQNVHF